MMHQHHYSLSELEDMLPWEREIYLGLLTKFFETMPRLAHVIEVKNPKTKKKVQIPIEGMQSFFV